MKNVKKEVAQIQFQVPADNACPICWGVKGGVRVAVPIYLLTDAGLLLVCYRSQCPLCGHITGKPYKLKAKKPDYGYNFWQELKGLNVAAFVDEVSTNNNTRYFEAGKFRLKNT